ncbi:MAG TPA: CHRD domain-containing protein [Thermoanaerobaculia bacterium]|nr:CHRD domain-containing protein [Thermoanaerobaculia bacterium]
MKRTLSPILLAGVLAAPALTAQLGFWDTSFQLDSAQEVPTPTRTTGIGECVASLQGTELTVSCTHTLPDPIAAHIHLGLPGVAGPILIPFDDGDSPIQGQFELTEQQVAYYAAGALYVNVHTDTNPAGEIRGQLVPRVSRDATSVLFSGDASQETEKVDSDAVAYCRAIFSTSTGENQLRVICAHTVEMPIAAHIHRAAPGVPGPIIFPFDDPESPLDQTFTLSDADVVDLFTGNLYVNVHTDEFPGGEVRANLVGCVESATQLCLQQNRFAIGVTGSTPAGDEFVGQAFERTSTSGEFTFFSPDNLELLVKVLDGCAINDRYWVFFAATTDVEFDLTVTDTLTGESKTYTNPQGNPADAVTDTDAFATCDGAEPSNGG